MLTRYALAGAILAAFATPSLAAEFYLVHDTKAKKCVVVQEKPTVETMVIVGDKAYATKAEAQAAIKTTKICKS